MGAEDPKRTYLVVIDDSEEARVALRFAARRAAKTNGRIEVLGIAERATGAPECRSPERPAGAADRRDERGAGGRQQLARRGLDALELADDRSEPAVHVRAVIGVSDRSVELRQIIPLFPQRGRRRLEPQPDRPGIHARPTFFHRLRFPSEARGCAPGHPTAP